MTMDYEQKYKEALGWMKSLYDGLHGKTKEEAEKYFPELQESEDEKVKRIIHSISNKISFHLHDIFTEEEFQCFDAWSNAWFKKQGNKIWTDNDYDKVKSIEYLLHEFDNHNFDDWFNSLKERIGE